MYSIPLPRAVFHDVVRSLLAYTYLIFTDRACLPFSRHTVQDTSYKTPFLYLL